MRMCSSNCQRIVTSQNINPAARNRGNVRADPTQPSLEDLYRAHFPSSFVPNAVQLSRQNKRQYASPSESNRVDPPAPLYDPPLVGLLLMS